MESQFVSSCGDVLFWASVLFLFEPWVFKCFVSTEEADQTLSEAPWLSWLGDMRAGRKGTRQLLGVSLYVSMTKSHH